jgi:uncharacterized membrane protein
MNNLHLLWDFITSHWFEIVLALIFAVVAELLRIRSRLGTVIRHIKNKQSERSARLLRERIKQLETQRDQYAAYSTSDKALYLATFRIVIGILTFMALGAGLTVLPIRGINLVVAFCYLTAVIGAIQGFKISALDTRAKVSEMIAKLDSEIVSLQKKLEAMAK